MNHSKDLADLRGQTLSLGPAPDLLFFAYYVAISHSKPYPVIDSCNVLLGAEMWIITSINKPTGNGRITFTICCDNLAVMSLMCHYHSRDLAKGTH